MTRIDGIRRRLDALVLASPRQDQVAYFFAHIYGVANDACLLAIKRGLDPEVAMAAGLLHDVARAARGSAEDHGAHSAQMAEALLAEAGGFTIEERALIVAAIRCHSDKANIGGPYDEALKDADVLQHTLYDIAGGTADSDARQARMARVMAELSAPWPPAR